MTTSIDTGRWERHRRRDRVGLPRSGHNGSEVRNEEPDEEGVVDGRVSSSRGDTRDSDRPDDREGRLVGS